MTLGNDNGTDGQTDRRTDRVRRNMRPPPREEGRIIIMAIELVQEIGRRTTVITQDTRETVFLFQRLSIALQRGNAVSFLNTMNTE